MYHLLINAFTPIYLQLPFIPPDESFHPDALCQVNDKIYCNLFDMRTHDILQVLHESMFPLIRRLRGSFVLILGMPSLRVSTLGGCVQDERDRNSVVHQRIARHYLGTVCIPFSAVYSNRTVSKKSFYLVAQWGAKKQ